MTPQYKRFIMMLTIVGSIMSHEDKKTRLHQEIALSIKNAIRDALKKDVGIIVSVQTVDEIFKEAVKLFENKKVEITFWLSICFSLDEKNFTKIGVGKGKVAKYYNTLRSDTAFQTEQNTREMVIWFYNKLSDLLEIEGYAPKQLFRR